MADDLEREGEEIEEAPAAGAGKVKALITVAAIAVLAIGAGLGVYRFVLAPRLGEPEEPIAQEDLKIPTTTVPVRFEEGYASVIMPQPEMPSSTLVFSVTLECLNAKTAALVEKHAPRFRAMLNELHEFRTREELQDPLVKKSIAKVAQQKANDILSRLQQNPAEDIRVIDVLHEQFMVHDSL